MFWDMSLSAEEVQDILKDPEHERFVSLTALILSRTTDVKEVFSKYVSKENFVTKWRMIKRRLKTNKWNQNIIYWEIVHSNLYRELKQKGGFKVANPRLRIKNAKIHELALIIKDARKTRKWSQADLAKKIGSTQQSISNIEKGQIDFSIHTFLKVTTALELNVTIEANKTNTHTPSNSN